MHLKTRNVNTALQALVELFANGPVESHQSTNYPTVRRTTSRNGRVLVIDEPVTVTYTHPRERVLFNAVRDANPFFHVVEALWMLAGRNDVALPAYYVKRMAEFSDDGRTLNGAYGYRWRQHQTDIYDDTKGPDPLEVDQLNILVNHLKANPDSRRAVLSMWNVEDDLLKIDNSKDVCCNLNVMFSLRYIGLEQMTFRETRDNPLVPIPGTIRYGTPHLDMTVTNRSNDLLWGMLGANYVHFSFLQEYMAARLGAQVGVYHHVTNNLHVYVDRPDWKPAELLSEHEVMHNQYRNIEDGAELATVPLVQDTQRFDAENTIFLGTHCGDERKTMGFTPSEPFLRNVAASMMRAHDLYRDGKREAALGACETIQADDWRIACTEWIKRRMK